MTYDNGQGRQLSDEEFDEYFEEVYSNEQRELSEADTQDDVEEETE